MAEALPARPVTLAGPEFASLPLSAPLLAAVEQLGLRRLTPIQQRCLLPLLAGKDLMGQSKTGSGKTLAFALPLLQQVDTRQSELAAIVVCPTRELSAQVARELRKLGKNLPGLSVVLLVGGQPVREQKRALERGAHLVVGTPGRLVDHLERRTLPVHAVATLVLDEADRLMEMGFETDVARIMKALPPARQIAFFSATFPSAVSALSRTFQVEPVRVSVEDTQAPIEQLVARVPTEQKMRALCWALEHYAPESALVFANLKRTVREVESALAAAGASVASLHGELEQFVRDRVMAKFRNGSLRVLVATDVAARGIDMRELDLVINYEVPNQVPAYVHRIGRTGRAERPGRALSLCEPAEQSRLDAIEAFTGVSLVAVRPDRGLPRETPRLGAGKDAKMATLRLSGGRRHKLRPGDILGALTGEAGGLAGDDIGKIEIHDHFSYVAVAKRVSRLAARSLSQGRIKSKRFKVDLLE